MEKRVALVTCRDLPDLPEDDRPVISELARMDVSASPEIWDDASVAWSGFDALVIRSTWDYHLRAEEFRRWIAARSAEGAALWNPAPLLLWNTHKFYLRELEARGVTIAPTRFFPAGDRTPLSRVFEEESWERAVLKPAVSATAHRTVVVPREAAESAAAELEALVADGDALVQKYLPEIETEGEWSFVFLDGSFSHAVRKRPATGDFRVQSEFGGTAGLESPSPRLLLSARRAIEAVDSPWLYARVDGVESEGRFLLMELELVEPSLFLSENPIAARHFASGIARIVNAPSR